MLAEQVDEACLVQRIERRQAWTAQIVVIAVYRIDRHAHIQMLIVDIRSSAVT